MSRLRSFTDDVEDLWQTSETYKQNDLSLPLSQFLEITDLLLSNPNLNSTHLFRADILYDSAGILQTPAQKENSLVKFRGRNDSPGDTEFQHNENQTSQDAQTTEKEESDGSTFSEPRTVWPDFRLQRTIIRKLIPRKPQLDKALDQACRIYTVKDARKNPMLTRCLVVYYPLMAKEDAMPWYHPPVRALAYLYDASDTSVSLSVHFLPIPSASNASFAIPSRSQPSATETSIAQGSTPAAPISPSSNLKTSSPETSSLNASTTDAAILRQIPPRLHRTLLSLLQTLIRLAQHRPRESAPNQHPSDRNSAERSLASADLKDTIVPQHTVQDTYTRLKQAYAADLIQRWVEKTEPSKHVFEDLSIASFLIELWKQIYPPKQFPGFVDIACGNGVLVYVLRQEGYEGYGFDARRRRTWDMLGIDDSLREQICVPRPFLDVLKLEVGNDLANGKFHDGIFKPGTFIISNHADELTPWTPILAALSSPQQPLPFLAIPCCSHTLSGARHRYSPKDARSTPSATNFTDGQSANGDLKALQAAKATAARHGDDKSMYACLTRKVVALAEELGFDVELTLMRIPSTRNIGIVGNGRPMTDAEEGRLHDSIEGTELDGHDDDSMISKSANLLERECAVSGGLHAAAKVWLEGARSLQMSKGRGKLNLGKPEHASST